MHISSLPFHRANLFPIAVTLKSLFTDSAEIFFENTADKE